MGGDGLEQSGREGDDVAALDRAIATLEEQRGVLGDAVVDTALQSLLEKRSALVDAVTGEQRKLVTVLFADLVDFTVLSQDLDAEDVRSLVNAYFVRWHEHIEANGGIVEKFIGDAVMAVFGLHQSHEDDPHRAIRAALEMKASLEDLNREIAPSYGVTLAMRVGIDTGVVVVTALDERPGQDLVVVGETVNRASRIQGAAPPGGVLISVDTHRHVRGTFALQPVDGLRLKGIAEPVDAYLVVSERPRRFRLDESRGVEGVDTRTVGRDVELRRLQDLYQDVVDDGQWRMVTILGDAGVGKTRLLAEFDRWIAELPEWIWWFQGRAASSDLDRPNAVWRDIMANRLEIQESDGPDVVREKWERGFERLLGSSERWSRRTHDVARWLGFDLGGSELSPSSGHDPRGLRDRATTGLAEWLAHLAEESPVVMLVEDLHWADDSSLAWIDAADHHLHNRPVLVLATARPALLERHPHWGEGLDFHVRLDMRSLSRRESRQLVDEILQKVDELPPSIRELVVTSADGNPFHIEELVKWLLDAGVITKDGETWHVRDQPIDQTRVPPTLRGLLQARLDALSPVERATLQRAAVVGRVFWDAAVDSLARDSGPVGPGAVVDGRGARPDAGERSRVRAAALGVRRNEGVLLQAHPAPRRHLRQRAEVPPPHLPRARRPMVGAGRRAEQPPRSVRRTHRRSLRPGRRPHRGRPLVPARRASSDGSRRHARGHRSARPRARAGPRHRSRVAVRSPPGSRGGVRPVGRAGPATGGARRAGTARTRAR